MGIYYCWEYETRVMIGKDYFERQATTLLKLARLTKDPVVSVGLVEKAADLQERSVSAPASLDAADPAQYPEQVRIRPPQPFLRSEPDRTCRFMTRNQPERSGLLTIAGLYEVTTGD